MEKNPSDIALRVVGVIVVLAVAAAMLLCSVLPNSDKLTAELVQDRPVAISADNFPDSAFRSYVQAHFDSDGDGYLSVTEREGVTSIGTYDATSFAVTDTGLQGLGITTLEGIGNFPNLASLVASNNSIILLDISENEKLVSVDMRNNPSFQIERAHGSASVQLLVDSSHTLGGDVSGMDVRYVE